MSDRHTKLKEKLNHISKTDVSDEEAEEVFQEMEEFKSMKSSHSLLHTLLVDPVDYMGDSINNSKISQVWDLVVNNTFIGRFFTQSVIRVPIRVLTQFMTVLASFLANNLIMRYVNSHDPAHQDGVLTDIIILFVIFVIAINSADEIMADYIRQYQGDMVRGTNLAELETKKNN